MKEYSDKEIIECLRKRQSPVVHYLFDQYLPMIRYMVKHMGGTSEDAKDIFQEGLMIILEKIDNRNFTLSCRFRTFLYCICENLWKSILTKREIAMNYLKSGNTAEEDKDISEKLDDDHHLEIFRMAYNKIDDIGKSILRLYWKGFSPQEIADKLNYTNGYVRKKKSAAQAVLIENVKMHPEFHNITIRDEILNSII